MKCNLPCGERGPCGPIGASLSPAEAAAIMAILEHYQPPEPQGVLRRLWNWLLDFCKSCGMFTMRRTNGNNGNN
jgi:hypothetical protein